MRIKQFEIWAADLNPQIGTEPGKIRPVLIIQTDLLNKVPHPSTIVCPLTTKILPKANILRVFIPLDAANLEHPSDVLIDQIRAIDNKRLLHKIGFLPADLIEIIKENISIVLDL